MLTPAATDVMDSVLDGSHPQADLLRPQLLTAIHSVLASEVEKAPPPPKGENSKHPTGPSSSCRANRSCFPLEPSRKKVDMDELIGTTAGFGDSG